MESLSEEPWDLLIVGTSLPQALLALSLSRSNLRILHVDPNRYYGGADAGLSVDEAEAWAEQHQASSISASATVFRDSDADKLGASRSYTLSLNPQIIYASSAFLPSLVTSCVHNQLDFLAVGSWWMLKDSRLQRIPSTREEVFADDKLSRKDKIALMKFLRCVLQEDDREAEVADEAAHDIPLTEALSTKFRIPPTLHSPVAALALAKQPQTLTPFNSVVSRIRRHLTSMNHFGPGFAAVYSKYAGNAEISQAACRAAAVGGAVYLLGQGIESVDQHRTAAETLRVQLTNGTTVESKCLVGSNDFSFTAKTGIAPDAGAGTSDVVQLNTVAIVSDRLTHLFPQTSDSGPIPAIAIVYVDDGSSSVAPIYVQIHSEDTGECPTGQCCVYASVLVENNNLDASEARLKSAIAGVLAHQPEFSPAEEIEDPERVVKVLWSMTFPSPGISPGQRSDLPYLADASGRVIAFPKRSHDIAFDDDVLASVKAVWRQIMGDNANDAEFLIFEDRHKVEG